MIQKTVKKMDLGSHDQVADDLKFWLSKSPEERVSAVELLRRQWYGGSARLQRVARVIQRKQS